MCPVCMSKLESKQEIKTMTDKAGTIEMKILVLKCTRCGYDNSRFIP